MFLALSLLACVRENLVEPRAPLALDLRTPTYGAYLGDTRTIRVEGSVSPVDAQVLVNRVAIPVADDGSFDVALPWQGDARAFVVDVFALDGDQKIRELRPVFDGDDPRATDPGAISGRLTPTGLDALEPLVEDQLAALGLEDLLSAAIPAIETEWFSLVPGGVVLGGIEADLSPGFADVGVAVTVVDITATLELVAGEWTLPMSLTTTASLGARGTPDVDADGLVTLTLTDGVVELSDPNIGFSGSDLPDWLADLLLDPIASLLTVLGDTLADTLLSQAGPLELGGPFAFEVPLGGADLAARLVDLDADLDGLALGATVATDGDAPDTLPNDLALLGGTTNTGEPYHLGFAVHEGLVNTVVDAAIGDFLNFELPLSGTLADVFGGGIEALPGGGDLPAERDGYCLSVSAGQARVARMVAGVGEPLATLWLPDVRFDIETLTGGDCDPWLSTSILAKVDLVLDGTEVSADLEAVEVRVVDYRANAAWDATAVEIGELFTGLAGLLAGTLSFDLADLLGGAGLAVEPELVGVAPLVGPDGTSDGRWAFYLDVF